MALGFALGLAQFRVWNIWIRWDAGAIMKMDLEETKVVAFVSAVSQMKLIN